MTSVFSIFKQMEPYHIRVKHIKARFIKKQLRMLSQFSIHKSNTSVFSYDTANTNVVIRLVIMENLTSYCDIYRILINFRSQS